MDSQEGRASNKRKGDNRNARSFQKKRLHILIDDELKAFKGWETVRTPWCYADCSRYISWCHVGRMWPYSRYAQSRRYHRANLNYCSNDIFKERCIQAFQHIYNKRKVPRNEVNFSILKMVYAEVILEVPVDWRTMEIQTNSSMGPMMDITMPYERKFIGDALGKRASEVPPVNEEVEWSTTSSDDSYTDCEPHVRQEIEYTFKYGSQYHVEEMDGASSNEEMVGEDENEELEEVVGKDHNEELEDVVGEDQNEEPEEVVGEDENEEPETFKSSDNFVERHTYDNLMSRHQESWKIIEDLDEVVKEKEREINECNEVIKELREELRQKNDLLEFFESS